MALVPNGVEPREDVRDRFLIAQDGGPTEAQLDFQRRFREDVAALAHDLNTTVADGREKSLAITHLEDALMWAGKAIFK